MSTDSYTLIAYKPSSDEYCMGCHMNSYSDAFEMHPGLDCDGLIKQAATYLSIDLDHQESGFELNLACLVDGVLYTVQNIELPVGDMNIALPPDTTNEQFSAFLGKLDKIHRSIISLRDEMIATRKDKEKQAVELDEKRREEEKTRHEMAERDRLNTKYGNGPKTTAMN